jgi:hypothetical protein
MADEEAVKRLEQEIDELKKRWPAHSVPPAMWEELEDLETQLEEARASSGEETHAGQAGPDRLPEV